jgi:pyruvate-ferredoxin/flavodoxin oxidoreductase
MAMTYGNVYVASVAMGARDEQTLKAFLEAEAFDGPSLIIAYSHCIAHGFDMAAGMQHQKAIVASGQWLLYRHDPRRAENALQLDSRAMTTPVADFMHSETRFVGIEPEVALAVQQEAEARRKMYQYLADRSDG